ncbi:HupE/UreJ family protein [Leptospira stimsonii]|uniref:HupE/UreJ family protein n=1 Tax=Leptospira stimsonii TaxID=2202203 RepID=A0ABY2MYV1_9LEPT|nr:HupE/UreJ family protein [Leptospira stimsonii]TGK14455.1 HupE/UreJ family protein [Leptospira stimsonii]TGM11818.1 HupE/UreJ family protein [Leptospira stimsonii]
MKVGIYVLVFLIAFAEVKSHNRSESFSVWKVDSNTVTGVVTLPIQEATRIPFGETDSGSLEARFADYIRNHVSFYSERAECEISSPRTLRSNPTFVRSEIRFDCGGAPPIRMTYTALFEYSPSHLHYARLSSGSDHLVEKLFQSKDIDLDLRKRERDVSRFDSDFFSFVVAGIEHIGTGIDHIAFLLALLLTAGHWKEILSSVTGFTIGHSLTLSVAVLGKIKPDATGIEALIGFTILIVCAEYVNTRSQNFDKLSIGIAVIPLAVGIVAWLLNKQATHLLFAYMGASIFTICYLSLQPYLNERNQRGFYLGIATVAFGMIHGFGFAGFLLETGLEGNRLAEPLFGFNLGVEIGQLLLVLSFVLLGFGLKRVLHSKIKSGFLKFGPLILLSLLSALGTYWFIERSF